ncbi:uncharacterized protein PGTG_22067 [Puccinia graminis f. sp. tritici CRL 75-36-700-3]|uniref:No apical meristem-associated C-terminal domain-containing protein n=1 Tax=Puccinia graminis f. sp. tritici (strain CRL 75-36-700-3 / race SCCL) TaxID=418459 RepID=H6QTM0_PUCGT|nr:uncharacterized protein PGTG_22067 [Puccinia graminis f. sp. tritici CRL 75-36-700-3]EHS64242.1 hypothetical protein PGTG_22067 [Puccinia graminis f. sp. tritici CRL 75-36-700-3]
MVNTTPNTPAAPTRTSPRKQTTTENPQPNNDETPKPADGTKPKNPRWTIEEDKLLCVAWLNTTRDAIVGTGQKATTFWERVATYQKKLVQDYNNEKQRTRGFKELPFRLTNAVECRWGHIMKVCSRFCGCYSQVERRLSSGKTRDDVLAEAKELYKAQYEATFNLDHCWGILKDTPKWLATQQENELKSKKTKEPKEPSVTPATDETNPSSPPPEAPADDDIGADRGVLGDDGRPDGNKAAKRKRKEDLMLEKVIKMQEEMVKVSQERAATVKAAMQSAADDRIMSTDLTGMDDETRAYWQKKKRAILDRPE